MTADRYTSFESKIRERAYHLWLEEGCPHGRQDQHWRRAQRELTDEERHPEEDPSTVASRHGGEGSAPEASAEQTPPLYAEYRQDPAGAEASGGPRSRAKSRAGDRSKAKPRARSSRPPAADSTPDSGSRAIRRPANATPAV
jgi:Protein of unknown function (DUF2934)